MTRITDEQRAAKRKAERERADLLRLAEPLSPWALREALPALLAEHEAQARENAALRAKAAALTTERDALRSVGARMSNVCFNLKQGCSPLDGRARAAMADLHREYDAIPRALAPKEDMVRRLQRCHHSVCRNGRCVACGASV